MDYSFYGGKQGISFNIEKTYSSIEEMRNDFSQISCTVSYGGYVIVNNEEENTSYLYRRGFSLNDSNNNYGAEPITNLKGAKGENGENPKIILENFDTINDNSTNSKYYYSELVPSKTELVDGGVSGATPAINALTGYFTDNNGKEFYGTKLGIREVVPKIEFKGIAKKISPNSSNEYEINFVKNAQEDGKPYYYKYNVELPILEYNAIHGASYDNETGLLKITPGTSDSNITGEPIYISIPIVASDLIYDEDSGTFKTTTTKNIFKKLYYKESNGATNNYIAYTIEYSESESAGTAYYLSGSEYISYSGVKYYNDSGYKKLTDDAEPSSKTIQLEGLVEIVESNSVEAGDSLEYIKSITSENTDEGKKYTFKFNTSTKEDVEILIPKEENEDENNILLGDFIVESSNGNEVSYNIYDVNTDSIDSENEIDKDKINFLLLDVESGIVSFVYDINKTYNLFKFYPGNRYNYNKWILIKEESENNVFVKYDKSTIADSLSTYYNYNNELYELLKDNGKKEIAGSEYNLITNCVLNPFGRESNLIGAYYKEVDASEFSYAHKVIPTVEFDGNTYENSDWSISDGNFVAINYTMDNNEVDNNTLKNWFDDDVVSNSSMFNFSINAIDTDLIKKPLISFKDFCKYNKTTVAGSNANDILYNLSINIAGSFFVNKVQFIYSKKDFTEYKVVFDSLKEGKESDAAKIFINTYNILNKNILLPMFGVNANSNGYYKEFSVTGGSFASSSSSSTLKDAVYSNATITGTYNSEKEYTVKNLSTVDDCLKIMFEEV